MYLQGPLDSSSSGLLGQIGCSAGLTTRPRMSVGSPARWEGSFGGIKSLGGIGNTLGRSESPYFPAPWSCKLSENLNHAGKLDL